MPSRSSKCIRLEVRGRRATASVSFDMLLARVRVKSNGSVAYTTCKPSHWRIAAAALVSKIHHDYTPCCKLGANWNKL